MNSSAPILSPSSLPLNPKKLFGAKACLGGFTLTIVALIVTLGLKWSDIVTSYENNLLAWQIGLGTGLGIVVTSLGIYFLLKRCENSQESKTIDKSDDQVPQDPSTVAGVTVDIKDKFRFFHYNCMVNDDRKDIVHAFMCHLQKKTSYNVSYSIVEPKQSFKGKIGGERLLIFYVHYGPRLDWNSLAKTVKQDYLPTIVNGDFSVIACHPQYTPQLAAQPDEVEAQAFLTSQNSIQWSDGLEVVTFGEENALNNQTIEDFIKLDKLIPKDQADKK